MKAKINVTKKTDRSKLVFRLDCRSILGFAIVLLVASPFALIMKNPTMFDHDYIPEMSIHSITSADVPSLNLTYTTRTDLTDTPVESGDTLAGDHVNLKAVWTPSMNKSRLEVHAPAIPSIIFAEDNQTSLELDTRYLGNNATCTIIASAWLANGTIVSEEFVDVYIGNFFVPVVRVVSPNGNENWTSLHNITWTASDVNVDDTFLFDVLFSDDSGASFDVLVKSTNQTWFEWDCSGLNKEDTYIVEVRATDSIYFSSDRSDAEFSAGLVVITTTTTTTTTTTNGPTDIEPRILAFIAILLISSGVMALVVYYAARKWF